MNMCNPNFTSTIEVDGQKVLKVEPEAITLLAETAMKDIAHLLRPGHLQQLRNILDDKDASDNDRCVFLICFTDWVDMFSTGFRVP